MANYNHKVTIIHKIPIIKKYCKLNLYFKENTNLIFYKSSKI